MRNRANRHQATPSSWRDERLHIVKPISLRDRAGRPVFLRSAVAGFFRSDLQGLGRSACVVPRFVTASLSRARQHHSLVAMKLSFISSGTACNA